jgi:hypothetical protein
MDHHPDYEISTIIFNMTASFARKKQRIGFFYGLVAGAVFSITAWGVDAIMLASAHVALPFAKFVPGLLLCALAGGLAGWLSIRIGNWLASIILWLLFGGLLVWLVLWLPVNGSAQLLRSLSPNLTHWIEYPPIDRLAQFRVIGMIVIGIPSLLCAILENTLVDQTMSAQAAGGWIAMLLAAGLLMGAAGFAADELLNRHFREPAQALSQMLDFAAENQGNSVEKTLARRMRLSVAKPLGNLVKEPRKMTLIAFDSMLGQMDFLIDFRGTWARCKVIYSQPTQCDLMEELTQKYYISDGKGAFVWTNLTSPLFP